MQSCLSLPPGVIRAVTEAVASPQVVSVQDVSLSGFWNHPRAFMEKQGRGKSLNSGQEVSVAEGRATQGLGEGSEEARGFEQQGEKPGARPAPAGEPTPSAGQTLASLGGHTDDGPPHGRTPAGGRGSVTLSGLIVLWSFHGVSGKHTQTAHLMVTTGVCFVKKFKQIMF